MSARLLQGDCLQVMRDMVAAGEQVDSIVTDPPYHLTSIVERFGKAGSAPCKHGTDGLYARQSKGFMGKTWDGGDIAQSVELWELAYALLKPGGHLLAFSATRTQHRMVCAIEDAGFEVRDQIGWMYGTGFPKSLDVSKAIDKAAGAEREVIGEYSDNNRKCPKHQNTHGAWDGNATVKITAPATPSAQQWAGWGTALKPAWEPICVARKPLSEKTVAANVLEHGTGAINIDACRVPAPDGVPLFRNGSGDAVVAYGDGLHGSNRTGEIGAGRWPANVIHDGSDEVLAAFAAFAKPGDGNPARFFYSAKASKADRAGSAHPTVKPLNLMKYLCRMATPPGGTVLDMFAGSGTTLQAALEEGFHAIGIEREGEYIADIKRRLGIVDPTPEDGIDAFLAELVA